MAVTATPGPSANSFISLEEAETFFSTRPHSADWDGLDDTAKESVLVMATRLLDGLRWVGVKSTDSALRWPRSYVRDLDDEPLSCTTIPLFLARATAELAMYLADDDTTRSVESGEFSKVEVGPLKVGFNADVPTDTSAIPRGVRSIISPYLKTHAPRLVRD